MIECRVNSKQVLVDLRSSYEVGNFEDPRNQAISWRWQSTKATCGCADSRMAIIDN